MIINAKRELIFDEVCPTPSCHASTVLPLENGDVLAAWFGGAAEGKDDVDIWVSRRTDGAWLTPVQITAAPDIPHWNPVLFRKADGNVILFFKVGKKIGRNDPCPCGKLRPNGLPMKYKDCCGRNQ